MLNIIAVDISTEPPTGYDPVTAYMVRTGGPGTLVYSRRGAMPTIYTHDWQLIITATEDA
jgi:hypothetical protein